MSQDSKKTLPPIELERHDTPYSAFFRVAGSEKQTITPFIFYGFTTAAGDVGFFFGVNKGMVPAVGQCENEAEMKRAIALVPATSMPLEMAKHFHAWFGRLIEKAEDPQASRDIENVFACPEHNEEREVH